VIRLGSAALLKQAFLKEKKWPELLMGKNPKWDNNNCNNNNNNREKRGKHLEY